MIIHFMRKKLTYIFALVSLIPLSGCYTNLALVSPEGTVIRTEPVSTLIGITVVPSTLDDCNIYRMYPISYRGCINDYFKYRTTFYTRRYTTVTPVYIYNTVKKDNDRQVYVNRRPRSVVTGTKSNRPDRTRSTTRIENNKGDRPNVIRPTRQRDTGRSTSTEGRTRSQDRSKKRSGNNKTSNNN